MTTKALGAVVAAILGVIVLCGLGGAALFGGGTTGCSPPVPAGPTLSAPVGSWSQIGAYSPEQVAIAATIVSVGAQMGVPVRGWIIGVATAIQESSLSNPAGGDQDSIGLFQQRPSQGWGTPEQLHDPVYASQKFFAKLLTIPNWQDLPLTEAAQAVQRSAYPDAYAKWESDATMLVNDVGSSEIQAMSVDLEQCLSNCAGFLSSGDSTGSPQSASAEPSRCEWVAPVLAPIVSGFRTVERPQHDGVDLGASRGTPIRAASSGVVVVVRCNVVPADYGCDRDGSPSTPGCGWYVDVLHPGRVSTRYCHMLTRPFVHEGQSVTAGQVIGVVGSSGHSSGPHLHFETHLDDRGGSAVDPLVFMRSRGVVLGEVE